MFGNPQDEASKLGRAVKAIAESAGGSKVSFDLGKVGEAVRKHRKGVALYVGSLCNSAEKDPSVLQLAQIVALAYFVEFNDRSLVQKVEDRARALGVG